MHLHVPRLALIIMAAFALLPTSPLGATELLTMRVTPRMAFAPATLVVDAIAERDSENRALEIEVQSASYYRSSLRQLDGNSAPRTTTMRYEGIPGGSYEVRVILFGSGGQQRASIARQVEVLSTTDR